MRADPAESMRTFGYLGDDVGLADVAGLVDIGVFGAVHRVRLDNGVSEDQFVSSEIRTHACLTVFGWLSSTRRLERR